MPAIDRKQARFIELRLSNVQGRFLPVVIAERQIQQFAAPDSRGEQQELSQAESASGRSGDAGLRCQARSRTEQFRHFGLGENVRLEPLMIWRKRTGVRNEALRFGPAAIQAEGANLQHANPPNPRSNVFVGVTPCLKRGSIQVRIFCALVAEESIQAIAACGLEVSKRRPKARFRSTYRAKDGRQAGRKHGGENRRPRVITSPPFRCARPELRGPPRADPRWPIAGTWTCSLRYDAPGCHRWS